MKSSQRCDLPQVEQQLNQKSTSPATWFAAADAAHHAGQRDKATRYLRMAINNYNSELTAQFDIKSVGDPHNA